MYVVASDSRQISLVIFSLFPHDSPGSDSAYALVSWFRDNSTQRVYKLAKSRLRVDTD